ncbi:MAG: SIR2 family protein [Paracoccaceae bacterium]
MKINAFLGSGVSVPSQLPTVHVLTPMVLRTDAGMGPDTKRACAFLSLLEAYETADKLRGGLFETRGGIKASGAIYRSGKTTYEDLYFLCDQIFAWANGLADNAQTTAFVEAIERRAGDLLDGKTHEQRMYQLGKLGRVGRELIQTVVAKELRKPYVTGLGLLSEMAQDAGVEELDVVTLNHDTLLEQHLDARGIEYADGFGERDGDVRWSDTDVFDQPGVNVRVLKLHGSINWYSFLQSGSARAAIRTDKEGDCVCDRNGEILTPAVTGPAFLTGIGKAISYNRSIYSDIHLRFQMLLRQTKRIVMSGYGWGDAAINFQLESWLDRSSDNKLILLHRETDELLKNSLTMDAGFAAWVRLGRIVPIEKWMCETTLQDIRAELV